MGEKWPIHFPTSTVTQECCFGIMDSPNINIIPCCLVFQGPWEDSASCTGTEHWDCPLRGPRVILLSGLRILPRITPMLRERYQRRHCQMIEGYEKECLMLESNSWCFHSRKVNACCGLPWW